MENSRAMRLKVFAACVLIMAYLSGLAMAETIPLMTKEVLASRLDDTDISILDVRSGKDWKSSEFKITGAIRFKPLCGK